MRLTILLFACIFAFTGCAGIQFTPPDVGEVITGSGPRLLGFFIGQSNPELKDKIVDYCDVVLTEGEPMDFKKKLDEGVDWLFNRFVKEPYIVMELRSLLPDVQIQTDATPTLPWMEKVKPIIKNFKTGVEYGAASSDRTFDTAKVLEFRDLWDMDIYIQDLMTRSIGMGG